MTTPVASPKATDPVVPNGSLADGPVIEGAPPPEKPLKRCKCGHDKHHSMVSPSGEYTFLGWVAIMLGISADPIAIRYQCRRCDAIVDRTTDPAVIAETRLWG